MRAAVVLAVGLLSLGCGTEREAEDGASRPLFEEVAFDVGVRFEHFTGATGAFYLPEIMAPGIALLDYDGDNDLDIYLLQGTVLDSNKAPSSTLFPPTGPLGNRLFENRLMPDGVLAFVDATEGSGLGIESYAMGAAVGDYDGDGDPDLYLTNLGPNFLMRNNGAGIFERVEGPQDDRWSTSATFFDYDGDGDLDLFFTNFVDFSVANNKECLATTGERDYCIPTVYNPVPDRLFRNDGGRFTDVSAPAGLGVAYGNGLGVIASDLNNDGRPDIYVANDTTENQLWINLGDGRFEDRAMQVGAAVNADGRVEAGMGVVAADFDSDGDEDLFMTHNVQETNTLYVNDGLGGFVDGTNSHGLGHSSLPYAGFGLAWADFDDDGSRDLFIATGAVTIIEAQRGSPFPFVQANQFYQGTETGFVAAVGSEVWGGTEDAASRGLATGDLDNDGDLDVVIGSCNGPVRLYRNVGGTGRSIRIRLRGRSSNTSALGSSVSLCFTDGSREWRRVRRDGSYLSSSEAVVHFGIRNAPPASHVEVIWPDGERERYRVPQVGALAVFVQGTGVQVEDSG